MMKKINLEKISKIVFFGSLWGLIEATIGYALHVLPALIAGSLIFPIVMFILYRTYKSLSDRKAVLFVGLIAIMIKATNLLLPFLPAPKTINPMISMALQSLLVFLVIPLLDDQKLSIKSSGIIIASIGWRLGMIGYYFYNNLTTGFLDFRIASFEQGMSFVLYEGVVSGLLALALILLTNPMKSLARIDKIRINPIVSTTLLVLALIFTLVKF